ncbi:hypothetical protein FZW96_03435 [Bacillus sp. BGMRC 2118]|nr:hypothetical protein FZW96_03435 [Bacillus sp. BGMRC 2118]
MIEVNSYFLKPNVFIDHLEKASINRNHYFINVNDTEKVTRHIFPNHPVYPGSIEIKHLQTTILGIAYNDSIDGLWYNIITCLHSLTKQQHASAPFIYHPYELSFTHDPANRDKLTISITREKTIIDSWELPREETIIALLQGAEQFFKQLHELKFSIVVNDTEDIFERITKLKAYYIS